MITFISIEDFILSDLKANFPVAFWISVAIAAFGFVCFKAAKFHSRFEKVEKGHGDLGLRIDNLEVNLEKRFEKIDSQFEKIDSRFEKIEAKVETKFEKVDRRIGLIEGAVMSIAGFLSTKGYELNVSFANSPRELTPLGKRLLVDLGGKDYVDRNKEEFFQIMDSRELTMGHEVQMCALTLMFQRIIIDRDAAHIQAYLYDHATYPTDDGGTMTLRTEDAIHTTGLYLRDLYFEKHPELKLAFPSGYKG